MSRRTRKGQAGSAILVAAVAIVAAAGVTGAWLGQRARLAPVSFHRPKPTQAAPQIPAPLPTVQQTQPEPALPAAPVPPATPEPAIRPSLPPGQPPLAPRYRVAIIFDDAGGSLDDVEKIIAIGRPVAVAVLPGLAYSADVALRAREAGLEVLLHLPLESEDGRAMGPGAISDGMSDAEIRAAVRSDLASVRSAVGINNHMGSKGTADRRVMRAVLDVAKESRLYFIDSRTSRATAAEEVALELGVRTSARGIFLDNENEEAAIREQIRRLILLARERGGVIAIGHAQRLTSGILAGMLEDFDRAGMAIVPPSLLVR